MKTVRGAPSLMYENRCTPIKKLENKKGMDEHDQKELVADLKSMRLNLKNIFNTDFANAVLPTNISETKYKT